MSATPGARERDSDTSTEWAIEKGDCFVEHATDAVLTVVEIVEHEQSADVRIESERPRRPVIRYRRSRADVRGRVRRGCWSRLDC